MWSFWQKTCMPQKADPADRTLLNLGGEVPITAKIATEGVFCCAELGWGKTWLVFLRFLEAYLRVMGGIILGAKAEDLPMVQRLFAQNGASGRLTVISPRSGNRVNWFEALARIAQMGSVTEEIVGALSSLMEIEQRSAGKSGGENSHFFKTQAIAVLAAILTILRLAKEPLNANRIYAFLVNLPTSAEQMNPDSNKERR